MDKRDKDIALIEAILFIYGEDGVEIEKLKKYFSLSKKEILNYLQFYQDKLLNDNLSGLSLLFYNNKVKLTTKKDFYQDLNKFFENSQNQIVKLSHPSLEVLSIIAYNENVNKKLIEQYRGVNSDSSLNLLLALGLIEVHKTKEIPFSNFYKVTDKFFDLFEIKNLNQLKKIILPVDSGHDIYNEN